METNRLRKSIKVELEHKFIRQKAEFLELVEKQLQMKQEKLKEQIEEDYQNLINANVKIAVLEKKNDEKDKIIAEQEIIIRGYSATAKIMIRILIYFIYKSVIQPSILLFKNFLQKGEANQKFFLNSTLQLTIFKINSNNIQKTKNLYQKRQKTKELQMGYKIKQKIQK